jgi:GTP-binding protein EngB required for normal cell division
MAALNHSQRRSVLAALLDVHRRLADMEAVLAQAANPSPFAEFVNDLAPTEARVVHDYFARLRTTMRACLHDAGIPLELRRTSVRWALQCGLMTLSIAVAEITPERLRGYGPLDTAGEAEAVKVRHELNRLIDRIGAYLRQGLGGDLGERLARLDAAPVTAATLRALARVIDRRGLVEFRPTLDQVVRRLEAPQFEVAVFGRVSSGKSSLLNHVAGTNVLPVGVTPITAVPTRLVRGDRPAALISFAEAEPRTVPVGDLREYASEEGNPGNYRHVTGILVQLPSPRLREGVVLVDTPGTGSLARAGSAETFAYLPRCDLGIVLVDAASTLGPDDLTLLRALAEAAVPAQVLLSKADLLTPADRTRAAGYVAEQLRRELGRDLPVHLVSTVGRDEALLTRWFEEEIEPLLARHRAMAEASLRRKIAHLRESVTAVLETLAARQRGGGSDGRARAAGPAVRRLLDEADAAVREAGARWWGWMADVPALVEIILQDAARAIVAGTGRPEDAVDGPVLPVMRHVLAERDETALQVVTGLRQALADTLESLRQAAALAPADAASVRGFEPRGLPALDAAPLREAFRRRRRWWASLLPRLAVWATHRSLASTLGPRLREQVALHDRQVQAWLKASVGQLVELYEAQAGVFREQVRRLAGPGEAAGAASDLGDLEADLLTLRQAEEPAVAGAAGGCGTDPGRP